jgi:hypothetical protein
MASNFYNADLLDGHLGNTFMINVLYRERQKQMAILPCKYKTRNGVLNLSAVQYFQLKSDTERETREDIALVKNAAPDLSISVCISCRTERATPFSGDQ